MNELRTKTYEFMGDNFEIDDALPQAEGHDPRLTTVRLKEE